MQQAYAGPIFSQQQEGWGSSETAVVAPSLFSPLSLLPAKEPMLQADGGGGWRWFCSYASCSGCQERACMLKERSKWQWSNTFGAQLIWRPA